MNIERPEGRCRYRLDVYIEVMSASIVYRTSFPSRRLMLAEARRQRKVKKERQATFHFGGANHRPGCLYYLNASEQSRAPSRAYAMTASSFVAIRESRSSHGGSLFAFAWVRQ